MDKNIFDENSTVGGVAGELSGVEWFDHDEVGRLLGEIEEYPPDARQLAAEILAKILVYCWGIHPFPETATRKFTAFTASLRPDLLGNKSMREIAAMCGTSKQLMSKHASQAQKAFGIKFARTRSEEGRKNMSKAAKNHKNTNSGRNRWGKTSPTVKQSSLS